MDVDGFVNESVRDRFDVDGPVKLGSVQIIERGSEELLWMVPGLKQIWGFTVFRNPDTLALSGEIECELRREHIECLPEPQRQLGSFPRRIYTINLQTDRGPCLVTFSNMTYSEWGNRSHLSMDIVSMEIGRGSRDSPVVKEFYRNAPKVRLEGHHVLSCRMLVNERFPNSTVDERSYKQTTYCPADAIQAGGRIIELCMPRDGILALYYAEGADAETCRKVSEFLSFLWGRRILKIGEQREDDEGILSVSISPADAQRALAQDTVMPIEHSAEDGSLGPRPSVTRKTQELIGGFLEAYDRYNLGYVMGLYFDATLQPPEAAIVRYQQVVEALIDAHFNDPEAEMIPPVEVDRIFGEQIGDIRETLDHEFPDSAESIEVGIRRAFTTGVNKRRNKFNEDLGIGKPPGIKTHTKRLNDLKHGRTVTHEDALDTVLFYRTYCNRILLSIMGEREEYRDLSALKDTWDEQFW